MGAKPSAANVYEALRHVVVRPSGSREAKEQRFKGVPAESMQLLKYGLEAVLKE
jgi:hypothetical protein